MITPQTVQAMNSTIQVLHTMKHKEISNTKYLQDMANKMLDAQGVRIEDDEVEAVMQHLVDGKYITNRDGTISARVDVERRVPSFQGKNGQAQILKILDGKVLHLYFYPLRKKLKEEYAIEFNVDGKGGVKLPDGTITNAGLGSLARTVFQEHSDRLPYQVATQNEWIVDNKFHTDAHVARSKAHFKAYMKSLYIQQIAVA